MFSKLDADGSEVLDEEDIKQPLRESNITSPKALASDGAPDRAVFKIVSPVFMAKLVDSGGTDVVRSVDSAQET